LFGIAKVFGGDVIQAFTLGYRVFLEQREILRRRHKTPSQILDLSPVRHGEAGQWRFVVTTVCRECRSCGAGLLKKRL
jgi:hypothetical protein